MWPSSSNNEQLGEGRRQEADKVEVRFRVSKEGQSRKGAVQVRTRKGWGLGEGRGGRRPVGRSFQHVQ